MSSERSLGIVVVLYKTETSLVEACLTSLASALDENGVEAAIVVVDNSVDGKLEKLFGTMVDAWVNNDSNAGFAKATNKGFGILSARYSVENVLFLNPDASVTASGLRAGLDAVTSDVGDQSMFCGWLARDGHVQVDAYMTWYFSLGRLSRRAAYRKKLIRASNRPLVPVQKVSGGALLVRSSIFQDVGLFDESFFLYGEDVDLSLRAKAKNIALFAIPGFPVEHVGASSQSSSSTLVERARTDAAIRLVSKHRGFIASLIARVELAVITVIGLLPGLGRSSGSKAARRRRLQELKRWSLRRTVEPFEPGRER